MSQTDWNSIVASVAVILGAIAAYLHSRRKP
jgi:hypothetical protein